MVVAGQFRNGQEFCFPNVYSTFNLAMTASTPSLDGMDLSRHWNGFGAAPPAAKAMEPTEPEFLVPDTWLEVTSSALDLPQDTFSIPEFSYRADVSDVANMLTGELPVEPIVTEWAEVV